MSDSRYYNDGASGTMFTGSTASEYADYLAGRATRPAAGGGIPLTGRTAFWIVVVLLSPPIYILSTCILPVAGLMTLLFYGVIIELMSGISWMVLYMVMIPWGYLGFMTGWAIEGFLEESLIFRRIRHGARILAIGFVVHVLTFGFFQEFPANTSFLERLTFLHVVIVALGCVAGHFISKKLDAGIRYQVESLLPRHKPTEWLRNKIFLHSKANQARVAQLEERIQAEKTRTKAMPQDSAE